MASINITNVIVQNNPSPYTSSFKFDIYFECLSKIILPIEWKVIYIGSAKKEEYDQTLDSVIMNPMEYGSLKFTMEVNL